MEESASLTWKTTNHSLNLHQKILFGAVSEHWKAMIFHLELLGHITLYAFIQS